MSTGGSFYVVFDEGNASRIVTDGFETEEQALDWISAKDTDGSKYETPLWRAINRPRLRVLQIDPIQVDFRRIDKERP